MVGVHYTAHVAPIGDLSPHVISAYGVKRKEGTSPHVGVDANYNVGPSGQSGINLTHPGVHAPVDGIVTNAGQGSVGRIAIRDANGFSHEILHTHTQHVAVGDRVVAGQLIGTMGNTGVDSPNVEHGDHHLHYQLRDPSGIRIHPSAFWDQQPNPASPAFLGEYRQYLRDLGTNASNAEPTNSSVAGPFDTGRQFAPGSATPSRSPYETRSSIPSSEETAFSDGNKNVRRLSASQRQPQPLSPT